MSRRLALGPLALATLFSACGYVGLELRELPAGDGGAADADVPPKLDARVSGDAARDASARDDMTDATMDAIADAALLDAGASCDLTGTWAVKVSTSVSWPDSFVQAASGTASTWLLYRGTQSGTAWTGTTTACGFALPDFRLNPLIANETYGVRVPDALFDQAHIAPVAASISVTGKGPGASITIAPQAFVIGTTLANPIMDPWPDNTVLSTVDTELDGQPGVTADYLMDASHVYLPLDLTRTQRADHSYFAVRLAYNGSGLMTSCGQLNGAVAFSHFDTHILGCHIAGGAGCNASLTDFLDDNRPLYAPSASSFQALKVDPATTCSQIRAALLP